MSRNLSFWFLAIFTYFISDTDANEAIIGGVTATPGEFPYQVSVQLNKKHCCGGGIIDDQFVLTAAHCVINANGQVSRGYMSIVAGTNDLNNIASEAVSIPVDKAYVSLEFNRKLYNVGDIAVLKLKHSLQLSKNKHLRKLDLPSKDERQTYDGKTATVAGFGWNWQKIKNRTRIGGTYDGLLRFAIADVIGTCDKHCTKHLHFDRQLCARLKQNWFSNKGVSLGDSGGPLVYKGNTVIGVVSLCQKIERGFEKDFGSLYTRVSKYLDFIHNAMEDNHVDMLTFDLPSLV